MHGVLLGYFCTFFLSYPHLSLDVLKLVCGGIDDNPSHPYFHPESGITSSSLNIVTENHTFFAYIKDTATFQ